MTQDAIMLPSIGAAAGVGSGTVPHIHPVPRSVSPLGWRVGDPQLFSISAPQEKKLVETVLACLDWAAG